MGRLFGTDGARGVANTELTCELAMNIGRAAAMVLISEEVEHPTILIGKDTRLSGDMLEGALIAGRHTRVNDSNTVFSLGLGYNSQIDILTNGNIRFKINSSEFTITPAKVKEVFGV